MAKYRNSLLLFLAAFIWGVSFVAQSVGLESIGPFTMTATGNFLGGAVLLPVIFLRDRRMKRTGKAYKWDKTVWIGGICCGTAMFVAANLQKFGIQMTTVGKAGFITVFYIALVPVIGLFLKKKSPWFIWCSVVLALVGLYFLCVTEEFTIGSGDLVVFASAFVYAIHILVIDHFAPKTDGVKLSCLQFFVSSALSVVAMLIFEEPDFAVIKTAWMPILYAGVLSCGVGTTLQVIGQKNLNPAVASLIMGLESVIAVLAGWLLLDQTLTTREFFGCALMFVAILIIECVPEKKKEETATPSPSAAAVLPKADDAVMNTTEKE